MIFRDYATIDETAARLGIHVESARRLIRRGELPAIKVGNKLVVSRAALEEFARGYSPRHKTPAARRAWRAHLESTPRPVDRHAALRAAINAIRDR